MRTTHRTRQRLPAAAALVGAAAAALVAAATFDGAARLDPPRATSPVNPGARDPADISANNSPTLAQNPARRQNLAVVNRVDTPAYTCGLYVSQDHGARWSQLRLPIPRGEDPKCFAPDVAFAADGTMYVSYVTLRGTTNAPNAAWLVRSDDGGRTLSAPHRVTGRFAFQVRLATDPTRPGRVYVTWLQPEQIGIALISGNDHRILVARSDDGGRSFATPVRVNDRRRQRVLAPSAAVGPDGALYVLYLDVGDDRLDYEGGHGSSGGAPYEGHFALVLGRSTDDGTSWEESVVDDRVVPTRRFIAFLPPSPALAIDRRSGRIFVAFEDGRERPSDVYVWSLASGEQAWDGPTRVNDTDAGDDSWQYLPKISVASDGRLDVVYYDRRGDPAGHRNHVTAQSSTDAGKTFSAHVTVSDESFDARIGAGSERGLPDLGSRIALVSESDALLAAWTDTRAGTVASNKQDIAFARAQVTRAAKLPAALRTVLRVVAIVLLLAAAALLVAPRRRREPPGLPSDPEPATERVAGEI